MDPPNRPSTPDSVHSWWSDSNSIGPTISIHAAAKPLMRLMYHRQVRSFFKRNQDTPITPELIEICLGYLSYKYISPATKSLILKELDARIGLHSDRDAGLMFESMELSSSLVSELLARSGADSLSSFWTMSLPTRPAGPESIHSWWSDSNSIGPTISIHAAAKPLMRLMYHQQVRSFIKRYQDTPISSELMEICLNYLSYKYISSTTKSLILKELDARVGLHSYRDASLIIESLKLSSSLVSELLTSPDAQIRYYMWNILWASKDFMERSTSWISRLFPAVVGCFSDSVPWIRESARRAFMKSILTAEGLDCCWDYLFRDNVSTPVKCFMLSEMAIAIQPTRLAPKWSLIADLLLSPELEIRLHAWIILRVAIPSGSPLSWALPQAVSASGY
ncbi:hypothetical protein R3P38DRAFT_2772671 [Favolaschia claudopus]|uniref:Uncharacterized protein n=1 Tax=Favolaschia claudopus TaxID=2862362 RepID=A0AAW0C4N3_9AGAR